MSEIKHCAWNGQPDLSLCQKAQKNCCIDDG